LVVGIDDWAWWRNQLDGTIICDLERRKTIALLPDREPATAEAGLCSQPQISMVARDRGGGYALAAAKALPNAILRMPTLLPFGEGRASVGSNRHVHPLDPPG
jgi:transposase